MSPAPTQLASQARVYQVLRARTKGIDDDGLMEYDGWEPTNWKPHSVSEALAPGVHRARVSIEGDPQPWGLLRGLYDDRLAITSYDWPVADRHVVFDGTIVDVDMSFTTGGAATLTAVSSAFRLLKDQRHFVYGRKMLTSNSEAIGHFTALPCHFNAGGEGNRTAGVLPADLTAAPTWALAPYGFTADGEGELWRVKDIVNTLWWAAGGFDSGLTSALYTVDDLTVIEANCEGRSLWDALANVADLAGSDCAEVVVNDGKGEATHTVTFTRRGEGRKVSVKHQPLALTPEGRPYPTLNVEDTDLFSCSLAVNVSSCVTAPLVAGGVDLFEITVELLPAWSANQPSMAEDDEYHQVVAAGEESGKRDTDYVKRYVRDGAEWLTYWQVGRLWDANTDGLYDGVLGDRRNADQLPDSVPIRADMAALALTRASAGTWPAIAYEPHPTLQASGGRAGDKPLPPVVEASFDDGATWWPLDNLAVLPKRLGVYLRAKNLQQVRPPEAKEKSKTENLFYKLWQWVSDPGANTRPRVRMTCCIASPNRRIVAAERRATGATAFATATWLDRGAVGRQMVRGASSVLTGQLIEGASAAYSGEDPVELANVARRVQDIAEGRSLEGNLPIEWPDHDIQLTDVVTGIDGLGVGFETNKGAGLVYPRVIGRNIQLTHDTYNMQLVLGTDRKAGIL